MASTKLINKSNKCQQQQESSTRSYMVSRSPTMFCIMALISIAIYYGAIQTEAYPTNLLMTRKYPVNVEVENPEELISTLDNLIQNILVGIDSSHSSNLINEKSAGTNKRGIDLGLSRGFSGSQAAKHLMGMSAASFANGPGRRR